MNRQKISLIGAMVCLLGLGFSDTAKGQTLTATPSTMSFQVQSGGASDSKSVTVTSSNGATTVYVNLQNTPTWMTVNNYSAGQTFFTNVPNAGVVLPIVVNTTGLTSGATYAGTFTIEVSGLPGSRITYTVGLTVGTPTLLSANPATLSFSATQGSSVGTPNPATVSITSSGAQLNYNISASTADGLNWLLLSTTTGTSGGAAFNVYVNPASQQLAAGTYTGTILVQSTTTGDSVTIPVTLSVTLGATLNVTGTLTSFVYQAGSGQGSFSPQQQSLMISTTTGTLNYQVQTTAVSGPVNTTNWLVPSSTGSLATTTPQPLYLSLSYQYVSVLPAGTYTINVSICPTTGTGSACPSGGNTTVIVATLVVSSNPLLNVNPTTLSFTAPFGSGTQSKSVNVTSSGGSIAYTVTSSQPWLTTSIVGGTTTANPTFSVSANASGLQVSTTPYTGTITIQPNNSDVGLYSLQVAVSLTVTSATSQIYAGPDQLLFSYQTTQATPGIQLVQLTSPAALGFSVSTTTMAASNCPTGTWLTATPSQTVTPAVLSVGVATPGMTGGSCSGTVIVTYNNGTNANSTVLIPVTVDISTTSTPLLTITPPFGFGVFTVTTGSSSFTSQISINSTDGSAIPFSANVSQTSGQNPWLSLLGSSTGNTQQYLTVQISPAGLPVGVYNGSITIHATNSANLPSGDVTLPVVLTVSASTTVAVSPTSLTFKQAQGASLPPSPQQITLTATGGSSTFTASVSPVTGGNWLQVTPLSGTATGNISASVALNTLSPGTYTSNITLTFQNSATPTATIPVTLIVTAAQTVVVSPTSLNFNYQLGSAAPASQTLNVTSTGGAVAISVGTTTSNPSGWLTVTPTSGSTGADGTALPLTVTIAPASFTTVGTYTGTIKITPSGQNSITVNVTVTVTGVPVPQPATISNSASGTFGAIAPGELITIKGTNIGPSTAASFTVGGGNTVSSTLSGVQVLFDTIPGTPTYVSATQINVIVPYEIAGRSTTNVVVSYQGQVSAGISQTVASQAPGIYTFNATGSGQASVLNQNGTYNGPTGGIVVGGQSISTTPAPAGSVIAVFMTGGGQTNPAGSTGTVTPTSLPLLKIPTLVTATINGVPATVEFAGAAPGLVTGVIQVNISVPSGVSGTGLPLAITINGSTTAAGPTVSVQ